MSSLRCLGRRWAPGAGTEGPALRGTVLRVTEEITWKGKSKSSDGQKARGVHRGVGAREFGA